VVRLIEIDRVTVRSAVPRALASLLRDGGEAVVRVGEGADAAVHRGSLRRLAANADPSGRLVSFELSVENPDHVLRPQMVVAVAVALESREAHFTVPLSSVRRGIDDEPFAFLVVGGEEALRVERRALGLGGLRGDRVSVVTGLRPGERVVTRGAELLTVGDPVTVVGEGP
jgi:membrane fusion protein (multidrug efflux system)